MKLKRIFAEADRTVLVATASAAVCMALYMNQGQPPFAAKVLGTAPRAPATIIWQFLAAFVCLGVLPALAWRVWSRRPLAEAGVTAGDAIYGLRYTAALLPLIVVLMYAASRMPDVRAQYPLATGLTSVTTTFLLFEAAYILYYVGWEFLFRGVLVLGIREKIGDFPAIALSTLVTTAIHLGKPEGEVWGAILVGVVFGWLAIRTRSVLYPLLLHAALGLCADFCIVLFPAG